QLGEILENDSVVMSIELFDHNWRRTAPPSEPLWRGVTMSDYGNGRWHRRRVDTSPFTAASDHVESRRIIRQKIRLEATDSPVLFGLRPMLEATPPPRAQIEFNDIDGTIVRQDPRSEVYDYTVVSDLEADQPQFKERLPGRVGTSMLLEVPRALHEPLQQI